jgi:hypothetical protein
MCLSNVGLLSIYYTELYFKFFFLSEMFNEVQGTDYLHLSICVTSRLQCYCTVAFDNTSTTRV